MIDSISKITLYVEDQEKAKKFWTEKIGFIVRVEKTMGPGMTWLEVAPDESSETAFVLYSKEQMAGQNPAINVGHPSVLLSTYGLDSAYARLKENGIQTGEIENLPYGRMFHFTDMDGNVFLLREDK